MDNVGQPESPDGAVDASALVGPADHRQLDVALGAQLGHRLEQRHEALHGDVAARGDHDPPRRRRHVVDGPVDGVVHPDRDHRHTLRRDVHLGRDVLAGILRNGEHGGEGPGHAHLHTQEPEPAARGEALPGVGGVRQRELAVHRDRMVQGGEQRPPVRDHAEHAGAEALVVVHHVEVVASLRQQLAGPQREGERLAEAGRAHDGELQPVLARGELAPVRDAERVRVAVEVQASHGGEPHPLVELGPGRACEDLDRVAERHQLAGQMTRVNTLATAARIAPIDEERHAQAPGKGRCGGDRGGHLDVARALPRLLGLDPLLAGCLRQGMSRLDPPWPHSLPERPGPAQTVAPPGTGG